MLTLASALCLSTLVLVPTSYGSTPADQSTQAGVYKSVVAIGPTLPPLPWDW